MNKRTQDPLSMESVIFLNMDEAGGPRKVARLLVHCSPQEHLNFKVSEFEKNDMDHVGGELGAVPDANKSLHLSFLSAKLGSMVTKMDTEFEARPEKSRRIDGRFVLDCVGLMFPHVSTCSSCSKMFATCVGDVFFFTCRSMDSAPNGGGARHLADVGWE